MVSIRSLARSQLHHAQNILFPPRCGQCRGIVESHGHICAPCWNKLDFLVAPLCHACGYPFEYAMDEGALCTGCMQHHPEFDAHRSALRFDDGSKHLVHLLKYYDQPTLLPLMTRWMRLAASDFLSEPNTLIVPVPLHPLRMLKRKYNQSALLAQRLAKDSETPLLLDGLKRIRHKPPQASLSRSERLKNTRGVFAVNPKRQTQIADKTIILVDDVMTTGATLNACAKMLKAGGAKQVYAVTLARTVLS
jgi:ComF family protein